MNKIAMQEFMATINIEKNQCLPLSSLSRLECEFLPVLNCFHFRLCSVVLSSQSLYFPQQIIKVRNCLIEDISSMSSSNVGVDIPEITRHEVELPTKLSGR